MIALLMRPAEPLAPADEAMPDGLPRAAFDSFVRHTNRGDKRRG